MRIRPFTLAAPQISASIPSETDYRGLSQTHGIITGSPLGQCSLRGPQMETQSCAPSCRRGRRGNGLIFSGADGKPFFSPPCLLLLSPLHSFSARHNLLSSNPVWSLRDTVTSFLPLLVPAPLKFVLFSLPPLLSHTLCVSTISPPCGQFVNGTQVNGGRRKTSPNLT